MQDLNDKITGDTLTAAEWNQPASEIQNVIEALGMALSGADLNQLGKGIAGYVANSNFYTDSGAANAYVLTSIGTKQSLTGYTNGSTFEFIAGNANAAGASTVNVAGLGVKSIVTRAGNNPAAGEISGRVLLKYDSVADDMVLQTFVYPEDTVANHTRAGNFQLLDGSTGGSQFNVTSSLVQSTYESVGPTGSGADNIWASMDVVPSNAKVLLLSVLVSGVSSGTALSSMYVMFASNDVASPPTGGEAIDVYSLQSGVTAADYGIKTGTVMVPLDSSQRFKARWTGTANVAPSALLSYRGFAT